jgi:nucleoside-diphosphate-sugar epimerase
MSGPEEAFEQGFAPSTVDTGSRRERRPPSESTALVTGATGFIGPHVVRGLLDSGRRVVAFDVRGFAPEGEFILGDDLPRVPVEIGSVADTARLYDVVRAYRPNEVVHMGMIIDPAYLVRNRTTGLHVNILGTVNVLEAAIAFGVDRIVNFSSIGVLPSIEYEPADANHPVILSDRGPGTDFYGAAKASSELLCYAYHQALGVDFRTIRPSAVYGLGMTVWVGPIKALVEGAVRGEPQHIEFGGPHPRDYTHARDIAGLVVAVLAAPDDADRVFYGATGKPLVTTSEVAAIVREVVPGADVSIGDELAEGEKPVVALRGRLSIENARAQLGWEPAYGSIRDGVEQYAEHYRAFLASTS